jgi:hypothetical protein
LERRRRRRCRAVPVSDGRAWDLGVSLGQRGERVAVTFEGVAFVIGESAAFEQLLEALPDDQQLPGAGLLGR